MSNATFKSRVAISGALCLLLAMAPARSEVGVIVRSNGAASSYTEVGIVDDPDPHSAAWQPYHPTSTNRIVLNPDGGANGDPSSYVEVGIVDDDEPFGLWDQYHPTSGDRIVLNPDGAANGDGAPSLIMSSAPGFPIAAWSKKTPQGCDVVVSRFDGTAWTTPQIVAGTPADELDPFLVRDPSDGSIHVVYWVNDQAPRVLHRQAPADLSSWSEAEDVSHPGDIACRPSAVFHGGVLLVAYELHDLDLGSTPRQIVLATKQSGVFWSEILATTQYGGPNWPIVHSASGKLWVDWIDTECEMSWRRQTAPGGWAPVENQGYQSLEERDFHVRGLIRKLALE